MQKDLAQKKDYYKLTIKNYQGTGLIVFHQNVRIFKSGIGLSYSGKLHERLNNYDKGSHYIGVESNTVIHHIGYLPEIVLEKNKKKRNHDIMTMELEENPTGYSYYNMGLAYMNDEDYGKALDMFKKSFSLSKDKEFVKGMLVRTGECLDLLNRTEEGIELLLDSIKVFPGYTDLHYTLGKLFQDCGYLRDAEIEFKECLRLGERVENISTEGVGSYMANYHLAVLYERQGRSGDAVEEWKKVDIISRSNVLDAVVMCLISRDRLLMDKVKKCLNLNNKEWETVWGILLYEANRNLSLTSEVEKLLLGIGEYLINANEFDQFQYISTFLLQCSIDTQEKLASVLLMNGFFDTALELLNVIIEEYPGRFETNILIGNVYFMQNKLKEALKYFNRCLEAKNDYNTYEKIYNIYDKMGDKKSMNELTEIMKDKFPLSI